MAPASYRIARGATGTGNQLQAAKRAAVTAVVSPELALVDPDLRMQALKTLPVLVPYEFLHYQGPPPGPPRRSPLPLAASIYLVAALARTLAVDVAFVLAVGAVVLCLNLLP